MSVGLYRPGVQAQAHDNFVRFEQWDLLEDCGSGHDKMDGPCYWDDAPGESSCFRHNCERIEAEHGYAYREPQRFVGEAVAALLKVRGNLGGDA